MRRLKWGKKNRAMGGSVNLWAAVFLFVLVAGCAAPQSGQEVIVTKFVTTTQTVTATPQPSQATTPDSAEPSGACTSDNANQVTKLDLPVTLSDQQDGDVRDEVKLVIRAMDGDGNSYAVCGRLEILLEKQVDGSFTRTGNWSIDLATSDFQKPYSFPSWRYNYMIDDAVFPEQGAYHTYRATVSATLTTTGQTFVTAASVYYYN